MNEETYNELKEALDNGEFMPDDWAAGNIDDAFWLGYEYGIEVQKRESK